MAKPTRTKVWHKVKAPKAWRPKEGQEIVGTYMGAEVKEGQYGPYKCHHVRLAPGKVVFVTGANADALFSTLQVDMKVKVVFNGYKPCSNAPDKTYKDYDLYTEEEVKLRIITTKAV